MKYICCPFYDVPKHDRPNGIRRRMHDFYAMTFLCSRTRQKNNTCRKKKLWRLFFSREFKFFFDLLGFEKVSNSVFFFLFLFPSNEKEKWIRHTHRSKLYLFSRNILHFCERTGFMDVTASRMSVPIVFWYVVKSWLMRSWNILICERERGSTLSTVWLMHLYVERYNGMESGVNDVLQ